MEGGGISEYCTVSHGRKQVSFVLIPKQFASFITNRQAEDEQVNWLLNCGLTLEIAHNFSREVKDIQKFVSLEEAFALLILRGIGISNDQEALEVLHRIR